MGLDEAGQPLGSPFPTSRGHSMPRSFPFCKMG